MNLKLEHQIYNMDFKSKEEFENYIENKMEKVENIKEKINKVVNYNYDYFDNHDLEEDFRDEVEDILKEIEEIENELINLKNSLRGE